VTKPKRQANAHARFGIESFRPTQEEAIRAVRNGRDILAVYRPGMGNR
jgi:superfamily II DNA helicase RecQ